MTRLERCSIAIVAGWLMGGGVGWTANQPLTATILGDLHHADLKEIALGQLAIDNGSARDVKDFGRMLIADDTAADVEVVALAKREKIDLVVTTVPPNPADTASLPATVAFDAKFAKVMLNDLEAQVVEVSAARDATRDRAVRDLLDDILPTLRWHRDVAKRLVAVRELHASL
jgi:putative membrane protein